MSLGSSDLLNNQIEILELKKITVIISIDGLNTMLDTTEKKIDEDRLPEKF